MPSNKSSYQQKSPPANPSVTRSIPGPCCIWQTSKFYTNFQTHCSYASVTAQVLHFGALREQCHSTVPTGGAHQFQLLCTVQAADVHPAFSPSSECGSGLEHGRAARWLTQLLSHLSSLISKLVARGTMADLCPQLLRG